MQNTGEYARSPHGRPWAPNAPALRGRTTAGNGRIDGAMMSFPLGSLIWDGTQDPMVRTLDAAWRLHHAIGQEAPVWVDDTDGVHTHALAESLRTGRAPYLFLPEVEEWEHGGMDDWHWLHTPGCERLLMAPIPHGDTPRQAADRLVRDTGEDPVRAAARMGVLMHCAHIARHHPRVWALAVLQTRTMQYVSDGRWDPVCEDVAHGFESMLAVPGWLYPGSGPHTVFALAQCTARPDRPGRWGVREAVVFGRRVVLPGECWGRLDVLGLRGLFEPVDEPEF